MPRKRQAPRSCRLFADIRFSDPSTVNVSAGWHLWPLARNYGRKSSIFHRPLRVRGRVCYVDLRFCESAYPSPHHRYSLRHVDHGWNVPAYRKSADHGLRYADHFFRHHLAVVVLGFIFLRLYYRCPQKGGYGSTSSGKTVWRCLQKISEKDREIFVRRHPVSDLLPFANVEKSTDPHASFKKSPLWFFYNFLFDEI